MKTVKRDKPVDLQEYIAASPKKYMELEKYFKIWAQSMDLEPAYLDWLIWCKESGNSVTALDC